MTSQPTRQLFDNGQNSFSRFESNEKRIGNNHRLSISLLYFLIAFSLIFFQFLSNANAAQRDRTAPTAPSGLTAAAISSTKVDLSWIASTDNVGVVQYLVFRNGGTSAFGSTTTNRFSDLAVSAGKSYSYTVKAVDKANNISGASNVAMVNTPISPDAIAPTVPVNVTASAPSPTQVNLTWSASTDNVGVAGYQVFRSPQTTPIGSPTGTSYSDITAIAGTTYSYTIKAVDTSGNISAASVASGVTTPAKAMMRGLWLWNSHEVLLDLPQQNALVTSAQATAITDVFLYLTASDYSTYSSQIQAFNSLLNQNGIRVWGLEGWRGYFSDATGPANFYAAVDNLIAFNNRVAVNERFVGFQSDMEPQDGQDATVRSTFHNDLTDAQLSTIGGGVWYATQAQDREMLMRDWLTIHKTARDKLSAAGLKMAAAMPFWTENYYGSPIMVTFDNVRKSAGSHMMNYLNDYIIMSYNTDPANAASRVQVQAQYASTLPEASRPRISAAMETHAGVGANISYADTVGKNSKQVVLKDMATIQSILGVYPAFSGVSIHDWNGWKMLPP